MSCKCNTPVLAMGLPNCQLVPERFVRAFFTTELSPRMFKHPLPFPSSPPWAEESNVTLSPQAIWHQLWALATPLADLVESERPEGVREEIGVNSYFVRESPRTLTFTFARTAPELGRLFRLLRCRRELGVILVDAAGVAWGRRADDSDRTDTEYAPRVHDFVAPIPVLTASIEPLMEFATPSTVAKWRLTLQLRQDFRDEDLVAIWQNGELLTYSPPMALEVSNISAQSPTQIRAHIFTRIHEGVGVNNLIPLTTAPNPLPEGFDIDGNLLGATANWTQLTPGYWQIDIPTGTRYIAFTPTQLASAITPAGLDWYNFRIDLP